MLEAKSIGKWLQARGLKMTVTPELQKFTVELSLTPKAMKLIEQHGCADVVRAIPPVDDNDLEVAIKVAMNLYDRDPEAGMLAKK